MWDLGKAVDTFYPNLGRQQIMPSETDPQNIKCRIYWYGISSTGRTEILIFDISELGEKEYALTSTIPGSEIIKFYFAIFVNTWTIYCKLK